MTRCRDWGPGDDAGILIRTTWRVIAVSPPPPLRVSASVGLQRNLSVRFPDKFPGAVHTACSGTHLENAGEKGGDRQRDGNGRVSVGKPNTRAFCILSSLS